MKKILIIMLAIALFGGGYVLISKKLSKFAPHQTAPKQEEQERVESVATDNIPFDTDDHLDEALQELDQIEQL